MTIGPKGYEATHQRVSELLSKFRAARPETSPLPPKPGPTPLQGAIGKAGGNVPFNPFGDNTIQTLAGAPSGLSLMIRETADRFGLDPALFESLIHAESDFNPGALSPKGAVGLTQLMPQTAKSLGVSDPYDPQQNLDGGAKYLAGLLKRFGGDERLALAAYNAGPGAVERHNGVPPFSETRRYVDRIMARVQSLRGR